MSSKMSSTRNCTEFTRGDLVWARLKGFPHWPAIVVLPPNDESKEFNKYVLFFGSKNHSWIKDCDLHSYDDNFERFSAVKDAKLQTAIRAVKQFRRALLTDPLFRNCSERDLKENIRMNWLVSCSDEAIKEVKNEKKLQKLKRKRAPGKDSTPASLARKKPKMSPSKNVRKEPKRNGKPGANARFQVLKKHKMYSFAKYARKEPKRTGKHEAKKAGLKKNTRRENSAQSCKASKKPKIAVSTKDSKRGPKHSKKPETRNKIRMEKVSSKRNSAQPRKASVKPKTSASAKKLRREQKRTPKPQVIVKKSKIRYMPSSGSSSIFSGPSTSSHVPEIANSRIVYDTDCQSGSFIRGPLQTVELTLGFVGIGELASALVSHLVRVGIHVLIWNRTASKCAKLVRLGAILADTPADVAAESDIVFCTVRGTGPITEVCFGGFYVGVDLNGIVKGFKRNTRSEKGFVMLSSIRPETSLIISQDFRNVNTNYLEAQVLLKSQSKDCDIRILCAGSKSLFEKLPNCFACTKAQFIFISGLLGEASRMKYAHTITHVGYALSLIEALAVLQESQKPVESLTCILDELDTFVMRNQIKDLIFRRPYLGGTIRELKDTLKELSEWYPKKPLHLATAAFEALDYASRKGADNHNISAMYDLLV